MTERTACPPVGALKGVEGEGRFTHAARRLAGCVRGEPVVGEDSVRGAVLQAVLKERHAHTRHLHSHSPSSSATSSQPCQYETRHVVHSLQRQFLLETDKTWDRLQHTSVSS